MPGIVHDDKCECYPPDGIYISVSCDCELRALRKGILECQTRILALERELAEAKDISRALSNEICLVRDQLTERTLERDSAERRLKVVASQIIGEFETERDEAYAAILAYKKDHDEEYQFAAQGSTCDCMICSEHALTICRASEEK